MRAVIQRVNKASVSIVNDNANGNGNDNAKSNEYLKAEIGQGYLVLLGCANDDTQQDIDWLSRKITGLRVFDDEQGVMNKSIMDVGGDIIVVSQFTLQRYNKERLIAQNLKVVMSIMGHSDIRTTMEIYAERVIVYGTF